MSALCLFLTKQAAAQDGYWELHPLIATTNSIYGPIVAPILGGVSMMNESRFIPQVKPKFRILQKIKTPLGNADIKYWDWSFKNLALGYAFGYTSFEAPLGFIAELNYERQTWDAKLPLSSDYVNFTRHSFAPEACLRLHFGGDIEEFISVLIESGIRYNLAFGANGDYKNKDCLNSGITGIFGIGYLYLNMFCFSIRYEHDFFDFFNQDFAAPDGTRPYKDFTTKHGALCWNIVYMF